MKKDTALFSRLYHLAILPLWRGMLAVYGKLKDRCLLFGARIYYKRSPYKAQYPEKEYAVLKKDKGSFGEYLLCYILRKEAGRWLFNLYIPGREEETEIDALFICERGIFLFESKNFAGWIHGRTDQRDWVQSLRTEKGIKKLRFFNPMMQNGAHKRALQALLPAGAPVIPMVVFGKDAALHTDAVTEHPWELMHLRDLKKNVGSFKETVLDCEQISALYELLLPYTKVSEDTKRAHISRAMDKRR